MARIGVSLQDYNRSKNNTSDSITIQFKEDEYEPGSYRNKIFVKTPFGEHLAVNFSGGINIKDFILNFISVSPSISNIPKFGIWYESIDDGFGGNKFISDNIPSNKILAEEFRNKLNSYNSINNLRGTREYPFVSSIPTIVGANHINGDGLVTPALGKNIYGKYTTSETDTNIEPTTKFPMELNQKGSTVAVSGLIGLSSINQVTSDLRGLMILYNQILIDRAKLAGYSGAAYQLGLNFENYLLSDARMFGHLLEDFYKDEYSISEPFPGCSEFYLAPFRKKLVEPELLSSAYSFDPIVRGYIETEDGKETLYFDLCTFHGLVLNGRKVSINTDREYIKIYDSRIWLSIYNRYKIYIESELIERGTMPYVKGDEFNVEYRRDIDQLGPIFTTNYKGRVYSQGIYNYRIKGSEEEFKFTPDDPGRYEQRIPENFLVSPLIEQDARTVISGPFSYVSRLSSEDSYTTLVGPRNTQTIRGGYGSDVPDGFTDTYYAYLNNVRLYPDESGALLGPLTADKYLRGFTNVAYGVNGEPLGLYTNEHPEYLVPELISKLGENNKKLDYHYKLNSRSYMNKYNLFLPDYDLLSISMDNITFTKNALCPRSEESFNGNNIFYFADPTYNISDLIRSGDPLEPIPNMPKNIDWIHNLGFPNKFYYSNFYNIGDIYNYFTQAQSNVEYGFKNCVLGGNTRKYIRLVESSGNSNRDNIRSYTPLCETDTSSNIVSHNTYNNSFNMAGLYYPIRIKDYSDGKMWYTIPPQIKTSSINGDITTSGGSNVIMPPMPEALGDSLLDVDVYNETNRTFILKNDLRVHIHNIYKLGFDFKFNLYDYNNDGDLNEDKLPTSNVIPKLLLRDKPIINYSSGSYNVTDKSYTSFDRYFTAFKGITKSDMITRTKEIDKCQFIFKIDFRALQKEIYTSLYKFDISEINYLGSTITLKGELLARLTEIKNDEGNIEIIFKVNSNSTSDDKDFKAKLFFYNISYVIENFGF